MLFPWCPLALAATFLTIVYAFDDNSLEEHGQYVVDVTDRYIVTLKPSVDVEKHMTYVQDIHKAALAKRQDGHGFEGVTHNYNITGYNGYAGHFDEAVIEQLKHHDDVDFVENDKVWTPDALVEQGNAGYGLVLISHRHIGGFPPPAPPDDPDDPEDPEPPRQPPKQPGKQPPKQPGKQPSRPQPGDEKYIYDDSAGAGTFAYVVDSGIDVYHPYFENRAYRGYTALAPGAKMFNDTYGSGTHVAGIMGSTNFGVAKKTRMIAVKVFQRDSAQLSKIIDGYRWAVNDIVSKRRIRMGVIAVTVYGAISPAFNKAVDQAASRGILTVVCAGNDNKNTARTRESAQNALTVGATDKERKRAPFSNYGTNVDIYAPGVLIMSTIHHKDIKNPLRFQQKSGTAQAAAYVAGLAVYFKKLKSLPSAKTTKEYILKVAIGDTVATPGGTRKPFAYNNSGR
ncbi:subtilisin-like protein [Myriangium duriaei CBS 260.36]|uniref:Subtilisin-like protein n=1 Tax=Myriangium duriaei CBS 260.36 TaxID=1168546 RepID=A0A9P4J237_9PEZI|nr:subtilisin-like protein [Myriangium duriaei CBS 260.36]